MTSRVFAGAIVGIAVLCAAILVPRPAYSHKPITTNILFKNEIAQIFQRKCFQCHSENNLAMPLTTYTDARPWARAIREEVLEREMPPWQAVPGYGDFTNDLSLNTREKEIILSWTDGGAPSGVLKAEESTPPVYVPSAPSWEHGEPDLVLPIGTHAVTSGAPFTIKRFVIATNLPAEKRVRAISLKQGDRRVVRHAAFYDEASRAWIGGWTPWQTYSQFAHASVRLASGARIAVEIGYSGTDEDVTDTSELGLYFETARGDVTDGLRLAAPRGTIDAGEMAYRVRAETKLPADTKVLAFWPEPGDGAQSVEITAITPEGMMKPLLWIDRYRPEWRSPFLLASAIDLPRGSRLAMTTYFNNPGDEQLVTQPYAWVVTAATSRPAAGRRK